MLSLMTWNEQRKGWMKKYLGKMYAVSCKQLGTKPEKLASQKAANDWWIAKENELLNNPARNIALTQFDAMIAYYEAEGQSTEAANLRAERTELATAEQISNIDQPLRRMSESGRAVWHDRFARTDKASPQIATVKQWRDKWLAGLQLQVDARKLSPGRLVAYRAAIDRFVTWFGGSQSITAITSATLWDYRDYLLTLCVAGQTVVKRKKSAVGRKEGIASATAATNLTSVKSFVTYLVERDALEPPKALGSKKLRIAAIAQTPKTAPISIVKEILAGCGQVGEKTKLYLLLMLNCGMYQGDISALKNDQIDFKAGTITRSRTKTPDGPQVTFYLWSETLKLLRKYKAEGDLALLNEKGTPLVVEKMTNNHYTRNDNIKSAYTRLLTRINLDDAPSLKVLRKTSATMLGRHKDYKFYAQYYLAQSARTIADKHYVVPSEEEFAAACKWLGEQFGQ